MTKKQINELFRFYKNCLNCLWLDDLISEKQFEKINKRIDERMEMLQYDE